MTKEPSKEPNKPAKEPPLSRLELRVVAAGWLAATVVIVSVVCAAFGWAIVASVLSIFALGVGAWLYHAVERLVLARRVSSVRTAAKPLQPLLPVMAALLGLTQSVVRSLSDATELPARRLDLPVLKWMDASRVTRRAPKGNEELDG